MSQIKNKIENKTVLWAARKRFRVHSTCKHNGVVYINATGANSEPGVGNDWVKFGSEDLELTAQTIADALGFNPADAQDIITINNKLQGVEDNATADQTGSEIVSLINTEFGNSDWQTKRTLEEIQDIVGAMLQAGTHTNITVEYDDVNGVINLTGTAGSGGTLTQEEVEDIVGGVATQGTGINVSYDDANNALIVSLSGESFTTAYRNKVDGIEAGANNYQHPATHEPSIINENSTKRFTSDSEISSLEKKRTRKTLPNTTQYTVIASDFTDSELHFTGVPAGSTINVVINTGVCPNTEPSTGLQIVVHPDSKISFSGTGTLTPQPGATLISAKDGSSVSIIGIKPTSTVNNLGVFGSLESDGTGGEVNVQSDWNQTDNTQDDFIKNKPAIPEAETVFTNTEEGLVPAPNISGNTTYSATITSPIEGATFTEGDVISVSVDLVETVDSATNKVLLNTGWQDYFNPAYLIPAEANGNATNVSLPSYSILKDYYNQVFSFEGSTVGSWELPAPLEQEFRNYVFFNRGTATLTLTGIGGANDIWVSGTLTNSFDLLPGEVAEFYCDGSNFNLKNKY